MVCAVATEEHATPRTSTPVQPTAGQGESTSWGAVKYTSAPRSGACLESSTTHRGYATKTVRPAENISANTASACISPTPTLAADLPSRHSSSRIENPAAPSSPHLRYANLALRASAATNSNTVQATQAEKRAMKSAREPEGRCVARCTSQYGVVTPLKTASRCRKPRLHWSVYDLAAMKSTAVVRRPTTRLPSSFHACPLSSKAHTNAEAAETPTKCSASVGHWVGWYAASNLAPTTARVTSVATKNESADAHKSTPVATRATMLAGFFCFADSIVACRVTQAPPELRSKWACVRPGLWQPESLREIKDLGGMQGPPPKLLDWLLERESATLRPASVDWATVGTPALRARAMPHQIQAVNRVVDACEGRAILAMPTGTGKSLVSAAAAAHYGGRVLVVASAQQQWRHEFETWTDMRCVLVNGASGDIGARGVDVVISTYKSVGLRSDIMATEWTTVIVDESHKLGGDCDTNAAVVRLCARARCALMVSATPMKGRPRELFNPLSALVPRVFDNRKFFEKRYCDAKMGKFGYEANGSTFTDELRLVVLHSLRVTCGDKTEVLPDLPPISFQDVRLPMPAEVRREFEDMQREYKELTKRAEEAPPHLREQAKLRRDALSMKMFKRTGEVKAPHAVRWLLEELLAKLQPDPTHKVLVFCHHQSVVQETCDALKRAGVPHVSVHGGTPLKKRHEALEAMRDPLDASARVAVLTLGTSAESLNLTGATEVVMFQLSFTPAQNDQAFARAWRKGATRPVTVYRMLADDTSDETILRIHRTKNAHNERLFGPGDDGPPQKTARMTS